MEVSRKPWMLFSAGVEGRFGSEEEEEAVKSIAPSASRRRCQLGGSKERTQSKVWMARL